MVLRYTTNHKTDIMRKILLPLILLAVACNDDTTDTTIEPKPDNDSPIAGYVKIWGDEFDGTELNTICWTAENTVGANQEQQYYSDRKENVRVEDGCLVIEAHKESLDGRDYTSGRINSSGKIQFKYGYLEARMMLPKGRGTWPAFWMLGTQSVWPACGEIDIMEFVGYQPTTVHGTIHTGKYNHMIGTQKGTNTEVPTVTDEYHTYTLDWTPENITISVDDTAYFSFDNDGAGDPGTWPFDQPFYIILNVAFGGGWGGAQGVDYSVLPCDMQVDWVRVYQKTE